MSRLIKGSNRKLPMNNSEYKRLIKEHLNDIEIDFPCHVIVYGPEKTTISMYNRSEYPSVFGEQFCKDDLEATNFIDSLNYGGRIYDLEIRWIEVKLRIP